MHSNFKMAQIVFPFVSGHFEVWTSKWPQTSNQNWQFRIFYIGKMGHFEVWMHIKSRDPISVTAVLGHFEVYGIYTAAKFQKYRPICYEDRREWPRVNWSEPEIEYFFNDSRIYKICLCAGKYRIPRSDKVRIQWFQSTGVSKNNFIIC